MNSSAKELLRAYPLPQLMQTIPAGLFLVDTEMRIVYWNAEAERITGYSAAEVVGQHCSFLNGIPCGKKCGLFHIEQEKPITSVSCSVLHRDGHRIDLSKNIDLLRNAEGVVIGGIEAFVDISRQKKLEESLRQSAAKLRTAVAERTRELELEKFNLRAVLDGMKDPAYICSGDHKICYMNRAMKELFGLMEGACCYEALRGVNAPCQDCPLLQDGHEEPLVQERKMGAEGRTYEIIHSLLPQGDGLPRKLGVCRDITERLESEERLRQANSELDSFVSMVSHDLRSPLTPLIGFSQFLQERYADSLDEAGMECLEEIETASRKMLSLLEDLLALSKVGQLERPEAPISTGLVVHELVNELSDEIRKSNATVTIGRLPAVHLPETLLMDLFRNLIINALRYAGEEPRIEIEGALLDGWRRILVRDHGPGIPPDEHELVFQPFKRGSGSRKNSGTGIGLATVQKIVRLYDGRICIEETPGGGATFVVEFADLV
ncbi:MAG TPA: ATP-binding protein [Geopsychrobacteraceae bacterium]|nr:ATP-binding protein [Geopsychrobacteraceae bacterium]